MPVEQRNRRAGLGRAIVDPAGNTPVAAATPEPAGGTTDPLREASRALGSLTELANSLPRLLIDLNAQFLACQRANRTEPGPMPTDPALDAAIMAARFALTEATTAALALTNRLADVGRNLAPVVADRTPT